MYNGAAVSCRPKKGLDMMKLLLLGNLGGMELVLLVVLVLLLFGGKKIPELMKGIGKGVKSFRDGMEGVADEEKPKDDTQEAKKE